MLLSNVASLRRDWLIDQILIFVYLEMSLFPSIFFVTISAFFLYGEYVVRSFLPNGVFFLPCDHGLDF